MPNDEEYIQQKVKRILEEGRATAEARRRVAIMNWDKKLIKALPPLFWIFFGVLCTRFFTKPVEVIRNPRHIPQVDYVKIRDTVYVVRTTIDSVYQEDGGYSF